MKRVIYFSMGSRFTLADFTRQFLLWKPTRIQAQIKNPPKRTKYKIVKTGQRDSRKTYNREYGRKYRMEHDRRKYFKEKEKKMSNLDLAIYYMMHFPPGTLVKLATDYPQDEPHVVSGVEVIDDTHYIRFSDGRKVCAAREELIKKYNREENIESNHEISRK